MIDYLRIDSQNRKLLIFFKSRMRDFIRRKMWTKSIPGSQTVNLGIHLTLKDFGFRFKSFYANICTIFQKNGGCGENRKAQFTDICWMLIFRAFLDISFMIMGFWTRSWVMFNHCWCHCMIHTWSIPWFLDELWCSKFSFVVLWCHCIFLLIAFFFLDCCHNLSALILVVSFVLQLFSFHRAFSFSFSNAVFSFFLFILLVLSLSLSAVIGCSGVKLPISSADSSVLFLSSLLCGCSSSLYLSLRLASSRRSASFKQHGWFASSDLPMSLFDKIVGVVFPAGRKVNVWSACSRKIPFRFWYEPSSLLPHVLSRTSTVEPWPDSKSVSVNLKSAGSEINWSRLITRLFIVFGFFSVLFSYGDNPFFEGYIHTINFLKALSCLSLPLFA